MLLEEFNFVDGLFGSILLKFCLRDVLYICNSLSLLFWCLFFNILRMGIKMGRKENSEKGMSMERI